ncbi:sensor histidine kinase [Lactobacillus sp. CC-MHH1034]|uniref:sensor histidine kinase n=1 Tax=Agrilactobacillus fermenti TaxID=2586909 RepID=UPI001E3966FE|nr:sensor histidine kinase [Agrilactobacillus fermenti]MCD2256174.1 sensor histidine kinase [Agrilactobacillus fermenti]
MKQILNKISIPKVYGGNLPYFFLIYLIFIIPSFWPLTTIRHWGHFALILVFIVSYRLLYTSNRGTPWWWGVQILIDIYFSIFAGYLYLFIYSGWTFGFTSMKAKTFRKYVLFYYVIVLGTIGIMAVRYKSLFFGDNLMNLLTAVAFIFGSPLVARGFAVMSQKNRKLRQANIRLQTQAEERSRIARDLHDNLGQSYSMITVKAELAGKLLTKAQTEAAQMQIGEIKNISRENLQLVRDIVNNLRQESLSMTLVKQEQNLTDAGIYLETQGIEVVAGWPNKVQQLSAAVIKEAVTNIIRYSHGKRCQIVFETRATDFYWRIQDNGRGFKPMEIRQGANGLRGIQQRVAQLNGDCEIDGAHHGTIITVSIPKDIGAAKDHGTNRVS